MERRDLRTTAKAQLRQKFGFPVILRIMTEKDVVEEGQKILILGYSEAVRFEGQTCAAKPLSQVRSEAVKVWMHGRLSAGNRHMLDAMEARRGMPDILDAVMLRIANSWNTNCAFDALHLTERGDT